MFSHTKSVTDGQKDRRKEGRKDTAVYKRLLALKICLKSCGWLVENILKLVVWISTSGILAGGTNLGHVVFWKYQPTKSDDLRWEIQQPSDVPGNVSSLQVSLSNVMKNLH